MNARESSARPDSAFPVSEAGLYLHVPFCLRKCPYCNFYSQATASDEVKNHYVDAVIRQISRFSSLELLTSCKVNTLFFGGGTPSILPAPTLGQLLNRCCESFGCMDDALEISIEVNPATIDLAGLFELRASGFNRISIGAQSFSDRELKRIGRLHDAEDIIRIVRQARTVGFKNLNIDLMYGLPGQSVKQWRNNLEMALALEPDHLSLYELTLEENTPFFKMAAQGELNLPPEDAVLAMLEETGQKLRGAGFIRYEISNYAKPGWECRHNINYWNNGSYIGLGASAVSSLEGRRLSAIADVKTFCSLIEEGNDPWFEEEFLDNTARFRETVIMGLRMIHGVSLSGLAARFSLDPLGYYGNTLENLTRQNLLVVTGDSLRLTEKGLLVANAVMAELV